MCPSSGGIRRHPCNISDSRKAAGGATVGRILAAMAWGALLCMAPPTSARDHGGHGHDPGTAVMLEEVTVTAAKIEDYVHNHPQQVAVVDRQEILERNFVTVEEALNSMPGVEVRPSAGIGSRISIRGSGKSGGVLVLLNGRPLNSSQYGGADLSGIPIEIVRSITVFKPPVPVWLGPGAADGAVSILTHHFEPRSDEAEKPVNRLKLNGGSYGLLESSLSRTAPLGGGSAMATASYAREDGKRTNSDKDKGTFTLHWDHSTETAREYDLNAQYYLSEYGSPGPTDNPTPDARQRYGNGSLDAQMRGFVGETGDYALKAYADRVDLRDESQSGFVSDLEDLKFGIQADATWADEGDPWTFRTGGIVEREDAAHTLSGDHHRLTAGLHAQCDRRMDPVTGTLGARVDHTSDFGFNPGLSGGLSVAPTEALAIKANAGYTITVPTFGQLYQPSHGSIDQVRGNPDLDEERIGSYDLSVEYRVRKDRTFQATFFRTDTRDPIVYVRGEDLVYRPENADRAWRQGLELTAKYAWDPGLSLDASVILQNSENRDTGKALAYTPRYIFKATLKYTVPRWETRMETTFRSVDDRYSEAEAREDLKLGDYCTVDLKLLQPFRVGQAAWEGYLNLINLFDADFENHYGYPDDGIRFVAGLNLTF